MFQDPQHFVEMDAYSEFEERWNTTGLAKDGRLLFVSHTWEETDDGRMPVRIISARRAESAERRRYELGE